MDEKLLQTIKEQVQYAVAEQLAAQRQLQLESRRHSRELGLGAWPTPPRSGASAGNGNQTCEAMIGELRLFAGTRLPDGWAFCEGQLLPIQQHQALFAVIGTNYGGNGQTDFALPDLRGCVPVHPMPGHAGLPTLVGDRRGGWSFALEGEPEGSRLQPGVLGLNWIIATQGVYPMSS